MFESLELSTLITLGLGGIGTFASVFWLKAKNKLTKAAKLGKETYELIDKVDKVLSDDKVTKTEMLEVKKEAKDVQKAWRVLIAKDK